MTDNFWLLIAVVRPNDTQMPAKMSVRVEFLNSIDKLGLNYQTMGRSDVGAGCGRGEGRKSCICIPAEERHWNEGIFPPPVGRSMYASSFGALRDNRQRRDMSHQAIENVTLLLLLLLFLLGHRA